MTIGTRGARLIEAVVRPQGASHIQAQPSKAIPIGPTAAQRMTKAQINRRRRVDIDEKHSMRAATSEDGAAYAHLIPSGHERFVDGIAGPKSGAPGVSEAPDLNGGPSRTRTLDPLIKSQLLYQLS